MTLRFAARAEPPISLIAEIGRHMTHSPFNTPQYAAALQQIGATPWALTLHDGATLVAGALALLTRDDHACRLEIPTAPALPDASIFWAGVGVLCKDNGVDELDVQSFAARRPDLPALPYPSTARQRIEFLLDLKSDFSLSTNHRRSVQKAGRVGLTLARSGLAADAETHFILVRDSLARRRAAAPHGPALYASLLAHDAGQLFIAMRGNVPLASLLALRTPTHAYYHSAGANPEALRCGAATWLVSAVGQTLRADGIEEFNLGGAASDAPGLRRFKRSFGATEVPLEARTFALSSRFARGFRRVGAKLRRRFGLTPQS